MKQRYKTLIGWGIWVVVFVILAIMGGTYFHLDHTVLFFLVLILLTIVIIMSLSRLARTKEQ